MDWTSVVIAVLSGGIGTAAINYLANRKKTAVEIEGSVATTAIAIMKQTLENTVDPLNRRIDQLEALNAQLRTEVDGQARTLEELNTKFVRVQLALVINIEFIRQQNLRPPVDMADLESLTTENLKDIAMGLRNARQRREELRAKKDNPQ